MENELKAQEKRDNKTQGKSNVLSVLNKPEALKSPDYPKFALQAAKRECRTLLYELNNVVGKQEMIYELEA